MLRVYDDAFCPRQSPSAASVARHRSMRLSYNHIYKGLLQHPLSYSGIGGKCTQEFQDPAAGLLVFQRGSQTLNELCAPLAHSCHRLEIRGVSAAIWPLYSPILGHLVISIRPQNVR